MAQQILPVRYARRIFRAPACGTASVAAAAYNELGDCFGCAVLVTATSLNHWRNPVFGSLRRRMDLAAVWGSAAYQLVVVSPRAPEGARAAYFCSILLGGAFYVAARRFNFVHGNLSASSWLHVCLHAAGNAGNLVLYDALGVNWLGWAGGRQV